MKWEKLKFKIWQGSSVRVVVSRDVFGARPGISPLEQGVIEGENPVCDPVIVFYVSRPPRVRLFGIAA